jgi:hypothetical protein
MLIIWKNIGVKLFYCRLENILNEAKLNEF